MYSNVARQIYTSFAEKPAATISMVSEWGGNTCLRHVCSFIYARVHDVTSYKHAIWQSISFFYFVLSLVYENKYLLISTGTELRTEKKNSFSRDSYTQAKI